MRLSLCAIPLIALCVASSLAQSSVGSPGTELEFAL